MAKDLYQFRTKEEEEEALMDKAIIRRHKSQTSGQGPSMALCVQTFKHHGAFSRYTPLNKRSLSMPELPQIGQPTIVEGMDVENQQMERDGKRVKRTKSTSAIDTTLLEPLQMSKAKGS